MSHATKPTDIGTNRTGLAMSPFDSGELLKAAQAHANTVVPDGAIVTATRLSIARQASPVGTMPPPLTVKGAVGTAIAKLKGESLAVLLDKLGERLAYERSGVRLYDALLVKLQASENQDPTLTIEALREIQDDELAHAGVVARAIEALGGDTTALTPCADVVGVMALGFVQVLGDPRTTLTQCLNTMLVVELADGASWTLLVGLAEELGQDEMAAAFRTARTAELRHQQQLQTWLSRALLGQADKKA